MTNGSSQGLFVIVAVVIFGIFIAISYIIFSETLKPALTSVFKDSTEKTLSQMKGDLNSYASTNILKHPSFNNLYWDNESYSKSYLSVSETYIRGEQYDLVEKDPTNKVYIKQNSNKHLEIYKEKTAPYGVSMSFNFLNLKPNTDYEIYMEVESLEDSMVRFEFGALSENGRATSMLWGNPALVNTPMSKGESKILKHEVNSRNYGKDGHVIFGGISKGYNGHILIKSLRIVEK